MGPQGPVSSNSFFMRDNVIWGKPFWSEPNSCEANVYKNPFWRNLPKKGGVGGGGCIS